MPTFPTAADLDRAAPRVGATPTPVSGGMPKQSATIIGGSGRGLPVASISGAAAPAPLSNIPAEMLYRQGSQFKEMAAEINRFGAIVDETSAQDALNELRAKRQELTYDPEKGYTRLKGRDVLKQNAEGKPVLEELPASFQKQAEEIGKYLISPRARAMYNQKAFEEQLGYKKDLTAYVVDETRRYEVAVDKDTMGQAITQAAQFAEDPAKVTEAADRAAAVADRTAKRNGLPSQADAARSNVYRVAIETQIANGRSREALQMFDVHKSRIDGPDLVALGPKMKAIAVDVEGENVAESYKGRALTPGITQYAPLVHKAAEKHGVRAALAVGVMGAESEGNPKAVSPAGAGGLMQIMSGTARDLGVKDRFNAEESADGGVRYLKQQLDKYGNERLALMAYNWGPGSVDKWIKDGADPDKIPAETREYIRRVNGYAASYGGKAETAAAQADILTRTDLSKEVKANAYARVTKESAAQEAWKNAEIKSLDDNTQVLISTAMLDPTNYKDGSLANYAERYRALGENTKAQRLMLLASMEGAVKTFTTSATEAQRATIAEFLKGLPKEVADAVMKGDTKGRSEAKRLGTEAFDVLKESAKGGVAEDGLVAQAKTAIAHFNTAADQVSAQQVATFTENAIRSREAAKLNPAAAEAQITELKQIADSGKATQQQLQFLDMAQEVVRQQKAAFDKDAFKAGTTLYAKEIGPPVPLDWKADPNTITAQLAMRAQQARQVSTRRAGIAVLPFSQDELVELRNMVDNGPPERQRQVLSAMAWLPSDMIPHVGAALAGKKDTGDDLSRAYASAMSLFAEKDPDRAQVGNEILAGARLIKEGGAAGRKPADTSEDWVRALNGKVGNAFVDMGGKLPAELEAAVKAHYVQKMFRAGRAGEKPDSEMLEQSIDAVIGKTITHKGQRLLPPKGVDEYQFDRALGRLTDGDTAGLRTLEGDPITAQRIKDYGILTNGGGDGVYFVRIPDPRAGMVPRPVVYPNGQPYRIDIKELMQRGGPPADANRPDYITNVPPLARPQ